MKARAPIIAGRRHDQDPTPHALADGVGQDGARPASRCKLAAADIDNVGSVLGRLKQGPRQVKLRAPPAFQALAAHLVTKHGRQQPSTTRRHARDAALCAMSPEDQACHLSSMPRGPALHDRHDRRQTCNNLEPGIHERRVSWIDGPIDDRDRDPRITFRLSPERAHAGDPGDADCPPAGIA